MPGVTQLFQAPDLGIFSATQTKGIRGLFIQCSTSGKKFKSIESNLVPLDRGRCKVVHPHSTLSLQCWAEPLQNEVGDMAKFFSLFASRG